MSDHGASRERVSNVGILLRAGFFLLIVRVAGGVFGWFFHGMFDAGDYVTLLSSVISIFAAAALASTFVVRIYERGRLEDIGMGWSPVSGRHFWKGAVAGAVAALFVVCAGAAMGFLTWEKSADPATAFTLGRLVLVGALLLFGAVGEELMFRGYAFQLLIGAFGPWIVIPGFAVLFALPHLLNPNAWWLGMLNTGVWGILLGYTMWRSGALWMPIGLHFGWNFLLPLSGARLSGFALSLHTYELKSKAAPWLSGGEYGPEGSALTTVACALLMMWLWRSRLERQPSLLLREEPELEEEPVP